jgi:hypothetical protein
MDGLSTQPRIQSRSAIAHHINLSVGLATTGERPSPRDGREPRVVAIARRFRDRPIQTFRPLGDLALFAFGSFRNHLPDNHLTEIVVVCYVDLSLVRHAAADALSLENEIGHSVIAQRA